MDHWAGKMFKMECVWCIGMWEEGTGVKIVPTVASSCVVNTLRACCVTSRVRTGVRMEWIVFLGETRLSGVGVFGSWRVIDGTAPGVLLCMMRRCNCGIVFIARFVVGFRDCIIGGASVIREMVSMGAASVTLCFSLRNFSCPTLCSAKS